jgi:serine/threonine-protein kinase/endoribonuclease IRE1
MYRRTADDAYIQSLPNGEIISFRARGVDNAEPLATRESQLMWGHNFSSPVYVYLLLASSCDLD